jgi:diguanylate cyclase (GGDEF)-like protein/PAS domain S-box-containing protein
MIQDIDAKKTAEFALAAAESRWRFALELAGAGVWDRRVAEGETFYSDAWNSMLGYSSGEISGASAAWQSLVHPDDLPQVLAVEKDHLAGSTPRFECEFPMRHKAGHWIWVSHKVEIVERDGSGAPLRMIGVCTDITARREAEELVRKTGEGYRLLADFSTDMILRVSTAGDRLYASPACRRLLGWEPEEMLRISSRDAIHPEDLASIPSGLKGALEGGELLTLIYRMRRKDGRYIWVESISRPIPAVEGDSAERIVVVRDIDQRIVAEQKLKDSEARYRLLAECATDMVFQLDHDLIRRYVSPACREILGYEPDELLGISPPSMVHPDDVELVAGMMRSMIAGSRERGSITNRIRHRDGRWIWVDAELRLLRDYRTGAPSGILGSLRDASKRKEAEFRLEQDNRHLASEAAKDGLTGLFNRRAFDEALEREYQRATCESSCLAVIMIDVDNFKAFNDHYGHPAGDVCLRSVSRAISGVLGRPNDCLARYGGEEFVVLLPDTDEKGALACAERIRRAVKSLRLEHAGTAANCVTISAGAASTIPGKSAATRDCLVQSADRALYMAKRAGRDTVCAATPDDRILAAVARSGHQGSLQFVSQPAHRELSLPEC